MGTDKRLKSLQTLDLPAHPGDFIGRIFRYQQNGSPDLFGTVQRFYVRDDCEHGFDASIDVLYGNQYDTVIWIRRKKGDDFNMLSLEAFDHDANPEPPILASSFVLW